GRGGQGTEKRRYATVPVGDPSQHRRPRGFERGRDEVGRADCGRAPAKVREPQGCEDGERPETECGKEAKPDPRLDRPVAAERVKQHPERLRTFRGRGGRGRRSPREDEREPCNRAERRPGPGEGRNSA